MDIEAFRKAFWEHEGSKRNIPDERMLDEAYRDSLDLCPDLVGMLSIRKQKLINLAFSFLPPGECYIEVGTFRGKSLLSAMIDNPYRRVYAIDNFSEFERNGLDLTLGNLLRYGRATQVIFFDESFREVFGRNPFSTPAGLYFYDGAHDEQSQYDGIIMAEPFLANNALVLVDDWRHGPDSNSFARAGTLRAMQDSKHEWRLLFELGARYNGDYALWWNGVGVLSFERIREAQTEADAT